MAQQPQKHLRILLLAPQPFYQDRGTPIAVRLLATELARLGHQVDLLVFHEGEDVSIPGVTIFRTRSSPYIKNIPPGFSLKKIICDLRMYGVADTLLQAHSYDLIHAVEESVFIAIATPNEVFVDKFMMGNQRTRIVQKAVNKAFELLQKEILKI